MDKDKEKYHEYLKSPEWKEFRKKAFEHYGKKCAHCKRTKFLQIHHKTYANIFNEKLEDVMVLCELHHKKIHGLDVQKKKKKKKRKQVKVIKPIKERFVGPKRNRGRKDKIRKVRGDHQAKVNHPNLDMLIANKLRRESLKASHAHTSTKVLG